MWFDPLCPWAWMTSRWLKEVEQVREVEVSFHVISLAVLNDMDSGDDAWGPVRVAIAVGQQHGSEAVDRYYTAIGTRFHPGGEEKNVETIRAALQDAGLPAELAEAATDTSLDEAVRASTKDATDLVGTDVGTPVIAFGNTAFFGPVVTPAPKGEDAGKLWDGCLLVANTPGFYELKRSREKGPDFA